MSWNRRVLQTRLSHFRSPNRAPLLLHHYHGLRTPSIAAVLIHQPFGKRLGVVRHSSSKETKPSEGDTAIENGMRLHVTKIIENECPKALRAYVDREGPAYDHEAVIAAQSALVTRYVTSDVSRSDEDLKSPQIELDWVLYSIVVQSPLLRRVLQSKLGYYFGDIPSYDSINTSSEHVELRAPFKPFLKERVKDAVCQEQDPETKKHLSLLCNVLEENLPNKNKMIRENVANGIVCFEDLPLMFKPGAILYTIIEGQSQLVRLREWYVHTDAKGRQYLDLTCNYIDWRGTRFGLENAHPDLVINEFEGPMTITDLPIYPLVFHPSRSEVEQRLISRGKKFEAHKGYHYRAYKGIGVDKLQNVCTADNLGKWCDEDNETYINGRVIIDTAAFYKLHPEEMERWKMFDKSDLDSSHKDEMQLRLRHCAAKSLSKKKLLLCAPTLRAYSVNDKRWLHIMVDNVKDIEWDDQTFWNLAMPQAKREMILAYANSEIKHERNSENAVQGKGNGVIVICGPPGAGKTSTAEAIAEELHAPLYTISADDLGITPEEIELFLTTTLEFALKWKAVLLLDDADAFVKTRSTRVGQDKNLVPIYQRILEYYDSVLFLNTNHTGGIDAAFETRAHHSSHYHEPGKPYRRVGDIFKEAQSLAMEQNEPLSLEHVMTVAQSSGADDAGLSEGPFYTRYEVPNDQW